MDDADTVAIARKISSPLVASLLSVHPNDVTLHQPPSDWSDWWSWAYDHPLDHPTPPWLALMRYFMRTSDAVSVGIPPRVCSLIDSVRSLQLDRTPAAYDACAARDRSYRISPKKEHEVDRMSSYIRRLVCSDERSVWHAVDVGSGQGYLSRALQGLDFHVLALDNNEHQTSGANRWTSKEAARKSKRQDRTSLGVGKSTNSSSHLRAASEQKTAPLRQDSHSQTLNRVREGTLTHRTVHVCPRTLDESVVDWVESLVKRPVDAHPPVRTEPVPVTLVALHACGSLTVDVLRTFLSNWARSAETVVERAWTPHSLVVVGCCYNLMSPSDFPLSKPLRDMEPIPRLTVGALHLAAQVPSQWLKNEAALRATELALRKVVYRALLQPVLGAAAGQLSPTPDHGTVVSERPVQPGVGETMENRRLGKLNDKAYQDWTTFLDCAMDKLGINLAAISTPLPGWFLHEGARLKMESALLVLQTLRCLLGPLIESLILVDRRDWIRQELSEMNECGNEVEVELVNLFDQSTGSGRNVAVVVKPATFPQTRLTRNRNLIR